MLNGVIFNKIYLKNALEVELIRHFLPNIKKRSSYLHEIKIYLFKCLFNKTKCSLSVINTLRNIFKCADLLFNNSKIFGTFYFFFFFFLRKH